MKKINILNKTSKFIKALYRHAIDSFKKTSGDERLRRLEICGRCPFRSNNGTCLKCGCLLSMKTKWKSESCPISKW